MDRQYELKLWSKGTNRYETFMYAPAKSLEKFKRDFEDHHLPKISPELYDLTRDPQVSVVYTVTVKRRLKWKSAPKKPRKR